MKPVLDDKPNNDQEKIENKEKGFDNEFIWKSTYVPHFFGLLDLNLSVFDKYIIGNIFKHVLVIFCKLLKFMDLEINF